MQSVSTVVAYVRTVDVRMCACVCNWRTTPWAGSGGKRIRLRVLAHQTPKACFLLRVFRLLLSSESVESAGLVVIADRAIVVIQLYEHDRDGHQIGYFHVRDFIRAADETTATKAKLK